MSHLVFGFRAERLRVCEFGIFSFCARPETCDSEIEVSKPETSDSEIEVSKPDTSDSEIEVLRV
jgi:hypothetical protein